VEGRTLKAVVELALEGYFGRDRILEKLREAKAEDLTRVGVLEGRTELHGIPAWAMELPVPDDGYRGQARTYREVERDPRTTMRGSLPTGPGNPLPSREEALQDLKRVTGAVTGAEFAEGKKPGAYIPSPAEAAGTSDPPQELVKELTVEVGGEHDQRRKKGF